MASLFLDTKSGLRQPAQPKILSAGRSSVRQCCIVSISYPNIEAGPARSAESRMMLHGTRRLVPGTAGRGVVGPRVWLGVRGRVPADRGLAVVPSRNAAVVG